MRKFVLLFFIVLCTTTVCSLKKNSIVAYSSKDFIITIENIAANTFYTVQKFNRIIQHVRLGDNFVGNISKTDSDDGFILYGLNQNVVFKVVENSDDFTLVNVSSVLQKNQNDSHCVDLLTGVNWFGGPEQYRQYYPIEKLRLKNLAYVPQRNYVGVAERYWLNSDGGFIYIDDRVPLFVDQNVNGKTLCFMAKNELPYNTRRELIHFKYNLGFGKDAKQAQRKAVELFLKKPSAVPDVRMVEFPIWSTWARYKRNISEDTIKTFASEIKLFKFNNSQLEIDDDWEICYGSLTFNRTRFPYIRRLTDNLREQGFRVTLWVHPFINKNCEPWYSEARNNKYYVVNYKDNPDTTWWNTRNNTKAGHIDFTNPEAVRWYQNRLKTLQQEAGIDSFKFDAGERDWAPSDPKMNADFVDDPLAITKSYVRAVSPFGPFIEVRTGQGTQDLPIFVRMTDKESRWTYENGLPSLITTLLQMNLVGYGFVLPDMVGGNGYHGAPSEELYIRWLQANVFMPSLQFSYVPWDYSNKSIEISRKFTKLHADYSDEIMKAFHNAVKCGEPVNPPLWWLDPNDKIALTISDEFLLGTRILSAPVISKGKNVRDVYLPKGNWFDPNQYKVYQGPIWLRKYPAPIDVLPYFILLDNVPDCV
ncbi:myogenesis-regulating glycosidase-like [Contarinia nasturtii]|uniref:myogenesis-regulating glycosidase-like n=1 Tax=Contarinia nasturtii TaxID=265458 RepID=UPI0012D44492|nr:myogenesis-regulating glycosidase-like [Contarinia nasturtii]